MRLKTRRGLMFPFGVFALALWAGGAGTAWAEAVPGALTVDIEMSETVSKELLALTLTLVGDHACASVKERRGALSNEIEACRDGGEPAAPVLSFKIDRMDSSGQVHNQSFKLASRMSPGKRIVLGKLHHRGGESTEISATLR